MRRFRQAGVLESRIPRFLRTCPDAARHCAPANDAAARRFIGLGAGQAARDAEVARPQVFDPSLGPPVPAELRAASAGAVLRELAVGVVPLATIFRGMLEFMGIQIVVIALLVAVPGIATWLPERLQQAGALVVSEAPPPDLALHQDYGDSYPGMYDRVPSWEDAAGDR